MKLGWYNPETFDLAEYEYWDQPLNGDMHVIMPCLETGSELLVLKGPSATRCKIAPGDFAFTPGDYIDVFKEVGVSCVVRLNDPQTYDRMDFVSNGIHHVDLQFGDCELPSVDLVEDFLEVCAAERGCVAIHCMAGLGRAGTMMALWLMKRHAFSAAEAIAWLRIVRPGCVIGQQQAFLQAVYLGGWKGYRYRLKHPEFPVHGELSAQMAAQVGRGTSEDDYKSSSRPWASSNNSRITSLARSGHGAIASSEHETACGDCSVLRQKF